MSCIWVTCKVPFLIFRAINEEQSESIKEDCFLFGIDFFARLAARQGSTNPPVETATIETGDESGPGVASGGPGNVTRNQVTQCIFGHGLPYPCNFDDVLRWTKVSVKALHT
jgi:hypothetical protein